MRRSLRYGLIVLAGLLVVGTVALHFLVRNIGPRAKIRVVKALEDRFNADVHLDSLDLTLLPQPQAVGEGLTIQHKGWNDKQPMIRIRRFTAVTDLFTALGTEDEVRVVNLEGLEIHIAPRGRSLLKESFGARKTTPDDAETDTTVIAENEQPGTDSARLRFSIQTIVADGTLLEIEPKKEGKLPLQFQIRKLTMHSVGLGKPMAFKATLTNAKPPGLIESAGYFGPWQRDDPRRTAVQGDYRFQNADLGVFNGIGGILSSTGSYHGVLQQIEVDGWTDTPDFVVKKANAPVHLKTKFHSVVDGTNGDTILDPVDATFLNTEMICKGGVVGQAAQKGKTVALSITTKRGRIEDILHLVIRTQQPPIRGDAAFNTKLVIPPGKIDVLDKLVLDGRFALKSAVFTNLKLQQRLNGLSRRAQGRAKDEGEADTAASDLLVRFRLDKALATLSDLSFRVPGATVNLRGTYQLNSEVIDMHGKFRMQATLSQSQTGIKHWLLKPVDPFFKKEGAGFVLPIKVVGTKSHPIVGADFRHKDAPPSQPGRR